MNKETIYNLARRVRDKDILMVLLSSSINQEDFSFCENDNVFWMDAPQKEKSILFIQNNNGSIKDIIFVPRIEKKHSPRRIPLNVNVSSSSVSSSFEEQENNPDIIEEKVEDKKPSKYIVKIIKKDNKKYKVKIPFDKFMELKKKNAI
jgi:hypothetical protein